MMTELIDRKGLKQQVKALLKEAQVTPKAFTALYLGILFLLRAVELFTTNSVGESHLLGVFVGILTALMGYVLGAGFVLYCMEIRRGQRSEFLTLFDGFSFVGKIIALQILTACYVFLWSLLFVFPGIVAAYRYRFAFYNLYENPGLTVFEALNASKRQTRGYKSQLFTLDLSFIGWNLLAMFPAMLYSGNVTYETNTGGFEAAVSAGPTMSLLSFAWAFFIQLFYLPYFRCVDLGYYESAKRCCDQGANPHSYAGSGAGPDNLGG